MAAPKGNKNAVGHDGSKTGRRSAYQEGLDAEWHLGLWQIDQEILKLQEKVQSRSFSARDIFALKVLSGNERLIKVLADKLLPDQIDVTSAGERLNIDISEIVAKKNGITVD